jgi:hypothetical protein
MPALRRVVVSSVIVSSVAVFALAACGSGSGGSSATTAAHAHAASAGWDQFSTPQVVTGQCSHKYPGELMTAAEAIVQFSRSAVCPGYVTVTADTAVTWKNVDSSAFTVTIRRNDPAGEVLEQVRVEPGRSWASRLPAGRYAYATDAIESFRGWVEVTGGAGA